MHTGQFNGGSFSIVVPSSLDVKLTTEADCDKVPVNHNLEKSADSKNYLIPGTYKMTQWTSFGVKIILDFQVGWDAKSCLLVSQRKRTMLEYEKLDSVLERGSEEELQ